MKGEKRKRKEKEEKKRKGIIYICTRKHYNFYSVQKILKEFYWDVSLIKKCNYMF